ncbi:MAG: dephospho-CoA kinase [Trichlorobacter sp.]|uniref:dephospho-CoA kinase n=1 Tax=Trichlorobacter sp. TaxID=2911007 RepID=UPI00255EC325|nr:dephospho-CoA kinase [Trichlorobacter sp.]MDK9718736.1 dephospho-CoA kinase [Trichlorobacter sp.]
MLTIGLTGGIATGKSSVAALLAEQGAEVIDADQLARDAVAPGTAALRQIVELFGQQALLPDGTLNRQVVRELVFHEPARRQQLEAILHPAIKELALQQIDQARCRGSRVVVYMAPLLIEAKATDRVDEIWVVTVRPEVQLARLMARDGCSQQQAEQIIAAQMPLAEKERFGVVVIDNSSSLEATRHQVEAAWQQRIGS